MHLGCVVLACNSGGPLESIGQEASTSAGFLLEPKPEVWASQIAKLLKSDEFLVDIKKKGKQRVQDYFSEEAFGQGLVDCLDSMSGRVKTK